ncbi:MAG: glycosyltransferase family 2 protein [Pleurocapsa sp.]
MIRPEVSIIIPAYNSEQYLHGAIASALGQTYYNIEVIVVDDASTDGTLEVARSFKDSRLKIIENQHNLGVSGARNRALQVARGQWIALLDSDDWYAPERIAQLLIAADEQDADLVADDLYLVREGEYYPWSTLLRENNHSLSSVELIDGVKFIESDRLAPVNTGRTWSLGYTKPLMKKQFLHQNNLNYDEDIKVGEDFALYLKCLLRQARYIVVPQAYYFYRNREFSLSTRTPAEYLKQSSQLTQYFINTETSIQSDRQLLMAMSKNLIIFEERLAYERILKSLKQKNLINVIQETLACPQAAASLLAKLLAVARRKITNNLLSRPEQIYNFKELEIEI